MNSEAFTYMHALLYLFACLIHVKSCLIATHAISRASRQTAEEMQDLDALSVFLKLPSTHLVAREGRGWTPQKVKRTGSPLLNTI